MKFVGKKMFLDIFVLLKMMKKMYVVTFYGW
jgi:hypothetical protein